MFFFLLVSGMLEKKGVFCVGQVCLKKFVFFLHVSGMLEKNFFFFFFFCVCQVC